MIINYKCSKCGAEYQVARLTRAQKERGVIDLMKVTGYTRKQALYTFRFDYCLMCHNRTGKIQTSEKRGLKTPKED